MIGTIQGIVNAFGVKKANRELEALLGKDPTYTENPYVQKQLGLAQNLFGGRMFGAQNMERNIFSNQANTLDAVGRNATDASQAIAAAAGVQGQTNNDLSGLQTMEAQNKYNMLGNLNAAYGQVIAEGDKTYNDKIRKYGNMVQIKGAQRANKYNAVNGIFNGIQSDMNTALSAASLGIGGFTGGGK